MLRAVIWSAVWAAIGCGVGLPSARASSPQLNLILPRGVQRGHQHVLHFHGARLADTQQVLLYGPGVSVVNIEVVNPQHVKATIQVDADCRLGEHVAQLRAASGISEFRTFYVGALPQIQETEPNNGQSQAQAIQWNVTVSGVVKREDVDWFAVTAQKGQRISVEVEGLRLGSAFWDPHLTLVNQQRFEIGAADDSPLVRQDAILSVLAPEDGVYYVVLRDSAYGGSDQCHYRLHVGTFPRPTSVYPAGGKLGESTEVTFLGDPSGALVQQIQLPSQPDTRFGLFASQDQQISPSPIPFRLSSFGNCLEQEPNQTQQQATPFSLPDAVNGIISEPGDIDHFRFEGKKGQVLDVECYARRIRSGLDPVVGVYRENGQLLGANDDSRGPDSYLRVTLPEDGSYVVGISDHLSRGRADFVYRIELTTPKPRLEMGIPRVARYSQYRQSVFVPQGNRFATLVSATRNNFGGPVVLDVPEVPDGITMTALPMPANQSVMPVVFEAAADAPIGGKLLRLTGRHADPKREIRGGYVNRADLVLGQPNNSLYYGLQVDQLAMAVIEPVPFKLELVPHPAPLVHDGATHLKVIAHRDPGFDKPIQLQFPYRPPGVSASGSVTIGANQTEALYPINANNKAAEGSWPIYVIGSANVNGNAWVASQMETLQVAKPFSTVALKRASCEPGETASLLGTLTHVNAFEGQATAKLVGLPPHVSCEPLPFTSQTKELIFDVKTEANSVPGKYKNLFVQFEIPHSGQSVSARSGYSELQIDKPIKPATATKPAQPVARPQPKPNQRPLSRLEKLRQAAKQRTESNQQSKQPLP